MAKNYIQAGEHITVPAPAAVISGSPVLIGALFGVAEVSADVGAPLTLARRGVFRLEKAAGQAWTVGQKLYWDGTNNVATSTATGNTLIGVATEAQLSAATEGLVLLDGTIR